MHFFFRFMKTMTDFDPIHTVYDHLSGRQPVALMVLKLFFSFMYEKLFCSHSCSLCMWVFLCLNLVKCSLTKLTITSLAGKRSTILVVKRFLSLEVKRFTSLAVKQSTNLAVKQFVSLVLKRFVSLVLKQPMSSAGIQRSIP